VNKTKLKQDFELLADRTYTWLWSKLMCVGGCWSSQL